MIIRMNPYNKAYYGTHYIGLAWNKDWTGDECLHDTANTIKLEIDDRDWEYFQSMNLSYYQFNTNKPRCNDYGSGETTEEIRDRLIRLSNKKAA